MSLATSRSLCQILFFILLGMTLLPHVNGAGYSIAYSGNDRFSVSWHVDTWQNLTGFPSEKVFPENLDYSLNSTELSAFTALLQNVVHQKTATATVSQTIVHVKSNNATKTCTPICLRQWFNLTISFQVHEIPTKVSSDAKYDMSWKAIRLDNSFTAAGIEINRIGEKYLIKGYGPIVNAKTSGTVTTNINGQKVDNSTYRDAAKKIVVLDMSRVDTPLESWNVVHDFASQSNVWTSPRSGGFLSFADLRESGSTTDILYLAETRVIAEVTGPMTTFASGDMLNADVSNGLWEKIALSIIAASIGLLAVTLVLERTVLKVQPFRRKTGKKKP
jgi:hypothetical protein